MSKLILASIDVTKIEKNLLYKGKKGTYLNLSIWLNDEPDQYGDDCSIQQTTKKDEPKIFLGHGKYFNKGEATTSQPDASNEDPSGLPF